MSCPVPLRHSYMVNLQGDRSCRGDVQISSPDLMASSHPLLSNVIAILSTLAIAMGSGTQVLAQDLPNDGSADLDHANKTLTLAPERQPHTPPVESDQQPGMGKIVGGTPITNPGAYGLAYLVLGDQDGRKFRCAATAIDQNWLITSNHCITPTTAEIKAFANPVEANTWSKGIDVTEVKTIEAWQPSRDLPGIDIALLKVPLLPERVQPVPIVGVGQPADKQLIGIGFGRHRIDTTTNTWVRENQDAALAISLPLQNRSLCLNGIQDPAIICAGEPWEPASRSPRLDFCTGDSGSPVGTFHNGRFVVLGIESRSSIQAANPTWSTNVPLERCGFAPTIATNLRAHLPFIRQNIGPKAVEAIALPHRDNAYANTLDIGSRPLRFDLRIPGTNNDPQQGIRIALQIAKLRHHNNPRIGRNVLLASNQQFADSLTSAALQRDAILLLTDKNSLPLAVLNQMREMGTQRVSILGGGNTIGDQVFNQIAQAGISVERLAGANRLATADTIASRVLTANQPGQGAYLVRAFGEGSAAFADSLAAGAAAARRNWPILLTSPESISSETAKIIKSRPEVTIVGGNSAISGLVRGQVHRMVPKVTTAEGADRTITAEQLAVPPSPDGSIILVDGFDQGAWHAGFAASGLAADLDAPILLVNPATKGSSLTAKLDDIQPKQGASFVCIADKPLCDHLYQLWLN